MSIYHKPCKSCGILKPLTEFGKDKHTKDGRTNRCKECVKKWRDENKESLQRYHKQNYEANKEERKKSRMERHAANKEVENEYARNYYHKNKDRVRNLPKKKYPQNKEKANQYQKDKKKNDPLYRLKCNLRTLICNSLKGKGYKKTSKTEQILGCSFEEFVTHIEKQFVGEMSWDNRHLWDIDHNVPVSWGTTEEEIIALNHYSNLQPLWREDNNIKGKRYSGDTQTILEMHKNLS